MNEQDPIATRIALTLDSEKNEVDIYVSFDEAGTKLTGQGSRFGGRLFAALTTADDEPEALAHASNVIANFLDLINTAGVRAIRKQFE